MIRGRLKEVMAETGATILGLAEQTGLSSRTIRRARGEHFRQCRLETLEAIAQALGVKVKDLFEEE